MMKKGLLSIAAMLLCSTTLFAGSTQLAKLATKHITLSQKIVQEYRQKNSASVMTLIHELESGQKQIASKVHNGEIQNLLKYLNLCVSDMKAVVKKPYSSRNSNIVSNLSASLKEGNYYIAKML
jgi:hypothetical protein